MSGEISITGPSEDYYELHNGASVTGVRETSLVSVFNAVPTEGAAKASGSSAKTSSVAEKLHSDWQAVLEAESKIQQTRFKCDSNISKDFFIKIEQSAKRLNCKPEDLAAIIYKESHFDPKAKNGSYTGLIQMNQTAFDSIPDTKCTYAKYCKLPREKQLKYAEKYLLMRIKEKI